MSDTPQGPGWWQASDDKWYPPESHPGGPNGTEAAGAGPSAPSAARPRWLLPGLGLAVVAVLLVGGLVIAGGADSSGDRQEFCELYERTNSASGRPSNAEMDRIDDLAPGEIAGDMKNITDSYRAAAEGGLEDVDTGEVESSAAAVVAWVDDNCGDPQDDSGPTGGDPGVDSPGGIKIEQPDGACWDDHYVGDPDC